MEQLSFTYLEIEIRRKTRKTRLERLTQRLESLIPWKDLLDLIRPHYFVSGRRGRQPYALELMLRIHLLQITYNLSDPQMEDCLHENFTVRKFVGLSMADRTPDETTILQFRHILEKHDLGPQIMQIVNAKINAAGLHLVKGRIVDASFIEAPTSTKNKTGTRDPEMTSGKKGSTWHFGMKMHVATDEIIGIAMDVVYGPANEHDITRAREVIADDTRVVYGDAGYVGITQRDEFQDLSRADYMIARQPGCLKTMSQDSAEREMERFKASVRSKVEHVFKRVKLDMGYSKTRYRGIKKNAHRISTLLAVANLFCFDCWRRRSVA